MEEWESIEKQRKNLNRKRRGRLKKLKQCKKAIRE